MTHRYTTKVTSSDPDFEHIFIREMCRELIIENNDSVDINESIFEEVMQLIQGDGGTENMFDAPILYTLVGLKNSGRGQE